MSGIADRIQSLTSKEVERGEWLDLLLSCNTSDTSELNACIDAACFAKDCGRSALVDELTAAKTQLLSGPQDEVIINRIEQIEGFIAAIGGPKDERARAMRAKVDAVIRGNDPLLRPAPPARLIARIAYDLAELQCDDVNYTYAERIVVDRYGLNAERLRDAYQKALIAYGIKYAVEWINKNHFVVRDEGGKGAVVYYSDDNEGNTIIRIQGIRSFIEARESERILIEMKDNGTEVHRNKYAVWNAHKDRRSYDSMFFDPSAREYAVSKHFNLWRGFSMRPEAGDWSLMKDHIFNILAAGSQESYDYIIRWCAWTLQNPGLLGETALCFVGDQGSGKSTLGKSLIKMIGQQHSFRAGNMKQISGNFNGHLRDKLFVLVDEAINPDSRNAANIMKGVITDEHLSFEAKGRDPVMGRNCAKVMIISNHEHFVQVEKNDRRYAVFRVNDSRAQDFAYFAKLYAELDGKDETSSFFGNGRKAMMYDLLNMDLQGWHPRSAIPDTEERRVQKLKSIEGKDALAFEIISGGELPYELVERSQIKDPDDSHFRSEEPFEHCDRVGDKLLFVSTQDIEEWMRKRRRADFDGLAPRAFIPVLKGFGFVHCRNAGSRIKGVLLPKLDYARHKWREEYGDIDWSFCGGAWSCIARNLF